MLDLTELVQHYILRISDGRGVLGLHGSLTIDYPLKFQPSSQRDEAYHMVWDGYNFFAEEEAKLPSRDNEMIVHSKPIYLMF